MATVKVDLNGLKETVGHNRAAFSSGTATQQKFEAFPMFLPVATQGKEVMRVTTRQDFISYNIGEWRLFHLTRAGAAMAGIGALWLFPINVYASAAAGVAAGWLYGEHLKKNFYLNQLLKKRDLLEST